MSDRLVVFMGLPAAGKSTALEVSKECDDHAISLIGGPQHLDELQSQYSEVTVVWLYAPPETRLRRARQSRDHPIEDSDDLREADSRALDSGMSDVFVGGLHDYRIVNTVSMQDFKAQVRSVMEDCDPTEAAQTNV
jgi:dephospho-CoA kinase